MNYSRRHFARTAAAGLPLSRTLAKTINSKVAGVQRSAQWCSFRDLGVDDAINAMVADGLDDCELFSPHIEAGGVQALMSIFEPRPGMHPTPEEQARAFKAYGDRVRE
jgi:hypothetical protein